MFDYDAAALGSLFRFCLTVEFCTIRIAELEKSMGKYRRKSQHVSDMSRRYLKPFPNIKAQTACAMCNQTRHDPDTSSQSDDDYSDESGDDSQSEDDDEEEDVDDDADESGSDEEEEEGAIRGQSFIVAYVMCDGCESVHKNLKCSKSFQYVFSFSLFECDECNKMQMRHLSGWH